jgi:diacylglycerol kinase family enzyme
MPSLLLITNANARAVTGYTRDVIVKALSAEFVVDVAETKGPGHAVELARLGVESGVGLVVALGGDGTVNEAANGLAGSDVPLAVVPAGGVNVFARSLGIPEDPIEATGRLLEDLDRPPRRINLGRVGDRYFLMNCGVGFDAAVVHRVEGHQNMKRAAGDAFFVWSALRTFFGGYDRRRPMVRLRWGEGPDECRDGLFTVIVQNAGPFVYWGDLSFRFCPQASFDEGLDAFALDRLRTGTVLRVLAGAIGSGRHLRNKHVVSLRDRLRYEIRCDEPLPLQADGEYLGQRDHVVIESVPDALSVLV